MNTRNIRFAHEDWSMIGKVIERLRRRATLTPIRKLDPPNARPVVLGQGVHRRRMRRMQPDAAMRDRTAEPRDVIGAMIGEAVMEEDRVQNASSLRSSDCDCRRYSRRLFPC
jgi:hypothetical protein